MTIAVFALAACTPGGVMLPPGGGSAASSTVDVNLANDPTVTTSAGQAGAYAPIPINVAVGTTISFHNTDSFAHTATLVPGASAFPAGSPFTSAAQTQSGSTVTSNWSTGTLAAGAFSQTITINAAGTYLYGCFFHYGSPMRGVIIAH